MLQHIYYYFLYKKWRLFINCWHRKDAGRLCSKNKHIMGCVRMQLHIMQVIWTKKEKAVSPVTLSVHLLPIFREKRHKNHHTTGGQTGAHKHQPILRSLSNTVFYPALPCFTHLTYRNAEKPQTQIWFEILVAFLSVASLLTNQFIIIASALSIPSFIESRLWGDFL